MRNIDTNTTVGKIAVMQAFEDGKVVQFKNSAGCGWDSLELDDRPVWGWNDCAYRIKPQTVEDAAREYANSNHTGNANFNGRFDGFLSGAKWQKEQMIEDIIAEQDTDNQS